MTVRANAAIYYVPAGYSTAGPQLMGIQAASEGLLRAMAVHAGVDRLHAFAETRDSGDAFAEAVRGFNPDMPTAWIPTSEAERVAHLGTLLLPGPGLAAYGWMRRRVGASAFSLCGVTHTTATPLVLDALAELWTAPVELWDAVICTSSAVRSMVAAVLEDQRLYLEDRFGSILAEGPQLPVIPLGVDTEPLAEDSGRRVAWRLKLGIGEDDVALLFVGRLNPIAKSHPIPLFLAAAAAARRSAVRLHLILAGWFSQPGLEQAYREAADQICPEVTLTVVDGRTPDVRAGVWRAADIFVSPVDNIQETFGLSPVEAMAAGLPVVVSDWDGYRETVRDGIDGLLIPTLAPPGGSAPDLARDYGARTLDYDGYVGASSQSTAVDVSAFAEAIAALAADPARRRAMGRKGRERARNEYDWSRIIPRYQALWLELAARRSAALKMAGASFPARPDPFCAFASYPTAPLTPQTRLGLGMTSPAMIEVLLSSPLVSFAAAWLPDAGVLATMVQRVEGGETDLEDLLTAEPPDRRAAAWRGIGWLLKYGLLAALPQSGLSPDKGSAAGR